MGGDPKVIEALLAALEAAPGNVAVRAHLAGLLLEAGRADEALDQATTVLAGTPDHLGALRTAAAAAIATGDEARAAGFHRLVEALGAGSAPVEDARPSPMPGAPAPAAAGDPLPAMPASADELLGLWDGEAAPAEPLVGDLSAPDVTLADVGGMESVKQRIEASFLAPLRHPELSLAFSKRSGGGLLLFGPPGCGKTFLARALAGELGASFYSVGLSEVLDMWIGASERNLASVFDVARRNTPCVLFFDEVDALGQKRSRLGGAAMRGVVNQLLAEMDGVDSRNRGVFVLGATNHLWDVDAALLRPGRFDRTLLVLPPDRDARLAILRYHLRDRPVDRIDLERVATSTEGYSGADLALVCEEATERALAASIESGGVRPITNAHLRAAVGEVRPSVGPWLETARNVALYANQDGTYDELVTYLKRRR